MTESSLGFVSESSGRELVMFDISLENPTTAREVKDFSPSSLLFTTPHNEVHVPSSLSPVSKQQAAAKSSPGVR